MLLENLKARREELLQKAATMQSQFTALQQELLAIRGRLLEVQEMIKSIEAEEGDGGDDAS